LTADLENTTHGNELVIIRQKPIIKINETKMAAFCRVGFTHHREILRKCKTSDERWYYILR
jgi:hypothetical protein